LKNRTGCECVKGHATSVAWVHQASTSRSNRAKATRRAPASSGRVGTTRARPGRNRRAEVRVKNNASRRPAVVAWYRWLVGMRSMTPWSRRRRRSQGTRPGGRAAGPRPSRGARRPRPRAAAAPGRRRLRRDGSRGGPVGRRGDVGGRRSRPAATRRGFAAACRARSRGQRCWWSRSGAPGPLCGPA